MQLTVKCLRSQAVPFNRFNSFITFLIVRAVAAVASANKLDHAAYLQAQASKTTDS